MALRIKIEREIVEVLEEEGYSKREIKKELDDLVDKEIFKREQGEQRKLEIEARLQREVEIRKYELEVEERNRQRKHEIELKIFEYNHRSSRIITQNIEEEKIQPYDEKGDLDSWLEYFGTATSNWSEEKRLYELKKAFLNTSVAKYIRCSKNIDEINNIICSN